MIVLFLLTNIDRLAMATEFGEIKQKICHIEAFIQHMSEIFARNEKFSGSDN